MTPRPRVGISRCLLGDAVRHDGTDRRNDALLRALGHAVEWVPICPEVEIGMGIPREPIQLVLESGGAMLASTRVHLVGIGSREDWTDRMQAWASERVQGLVRLGLSGTCSRFGRPAAVFAMCPYSAQGQ